MSIVLYVEGGAKGNLATKCRRGFSQFLNKAGLSGRMPRIFACGSRQDAYEDYCEAIKSGKTAMLLVDSEAPVIASADKAKPWQHVKNRQGDGWPQPSGVSDDDLHFMVLCMEAWLLADKEVLATYFGSRFKANSLPKRKEIEKISKEDIYDKLSRATRGTQKGEYGKGKHSFEILALIDPEKVRLASPYADRFLKRLKNI